MGDKSKSDTELNSLQESLTMKYSLGSYLNSSIPKNTSSAQGNVNLLKNIINQSKGE